jgi:hypothetical protein
MPLFCWTLVVEVLNMLGSQLDFELLLALVLAVICRVGFGIRVRRRKGR